MDRTTSSLLACLLAFVLPVSAQGLRLQPLAEDGRVMLVGAENIGPCEVPVPVALESSDEGLVLLLDTAPRPACTATSSGPELAFSIDDLIEGEIDGEGLLRVFMVDSSHPDRSLGMNFIELGEPAAWDPESGQWWPERSSGDDDAGPGTGLFLEVQNGAISLFFATYDASGQADWLMAAGHLDGRVFRGDLLRFSGGQPLFGEYRAPGAAERVAGVELAFLSPSRAEMWLQREGEGGMHLQRVPLTRFLFGLPPDVRAWRGDWSVQDLGDNDLPQQLSFDRLFTVSGIQFLVDASGRFELTCNTTRQSMRETLPQLCTLHDLEAGRALIELDNNALDALSGRGGDGHAVNLKRR